MFSCAVYPPMCRTLAGLDVTDLETLSDRADPIIHDHIARSAVCNVSAHKPDDDNPTEASPASMSRLLCTNRC